MGGAGDNVLVGGDGDDRLIGGSRRDLLVGGQGADRIHGRPGDDILIAGTTAFDSNDEALLAIMAEWTSDRDYFSRVANLRGDSSSPDFDDRHNDGFFLRMDGENATVFDDGDHDFLSGASGLDWFFANLATGEDDIARVRRVKLLGDSWVERIRHR